MDEPKWQPKSPLVTASELPLLSTLHRVLVIHCGAVWNGQDTRFDERLQPLRDEFSPRLGIYALDIENRENWPFCQETNVVNVPALVCLIGGAWQKTRIGARPESELRLLFQEWLAVADTAPAA